jgi:hypothetical protein
MKIDGGCHCGYIAYEAEADPANAMICHCTDCQTLSGSAFRTVIFIQEDSFKLRSGELKIYVKTGESGTERPQSFCPKCGTPIYSTTLGEGPKVHSIRLGTVHQREQLVPRLQVWFRSAQHWVIDLDSIPKLETQPIFSRSGGVSGNV